MVNKTLWFGILVIVLVFGMLYTSCDNDSIGKSTGNGLGEESSSGSGNGSNGGNTGGSGNGSDGGNTGGSGNGSNGGNTGGSGNGSDGGYTGGSVPDSVKIVDITPDSIKYTTNIHDAWDQSFTITVDYVLSSLESTTLQVEIGIALSNRVRRVKANEEYIVNKGSGKHIFNITIFQDLLHDPDSTYNGIGKRPRAVNATASLGSFVYDTYNLLQE